MVLLGNKADLNAIREVDDGRARGWAQSHGIQPYEVTVINRDGLKVPFCYITWRMSNPGKTDVSVCPCFLVMFGVDMLIT